VLGPQRLGVLDLGNAAGTALPLPRADLLAATADAIAAAAADARSPWVKVNAQHAGFFRTIYDRGLLTRLLPALRTPPDRSAVPALGSIDRLGLVGDVWAGVQLGMTSASDLLPVLWACRYDADYNVWVAVLDAAGGLRDVAEAVSAELGAAVSRFTAALISPAVELVGWEAAPGEHPNTPLLRALVLRAAAINGSAAVVARCLDLFDDSAGTIPSDLRQLVCE
jgi:hypothetical protein